MKKRKDETAIEFIRRVIEWINYEQESLLSDLPTVQAVFEYAELWSVYGVDLMEGIVEEIEYCGADPAPLAEFIKKHKLNWTVPTPKPYSDQE